MVVALFDYPLHLSINLLSFIMGYKLYESRNGITAAGPDKDKILRDLSYYHINYVISEYGEGCPGF